MRRAASEAEHMSAPDDALHPARRFFLLPKGRPHMSAPDDALHPARRFFLLPKGRPHMLDREIARQAKESPVARRLMTIPGIGAVTAAALTALTPPAHTFRCGRDFAAWLGLTPVQRSSGGKERLG